MLLLRNQSRDNTAELTKASDGALEAESSPPIDYGSMLDGIRPIPCAIQVGTENPIIGDPINVGSTPGFGIRLRLDPGKTTTPGLGLDFRISKTGKDSNREDDYNSCSISWEPGVDYDGQFMMEQLYFRRSDTPNPDLARMAYPPAIRALVHKKEDEHKLVCATFKSNVHKATTFNPSWVVHLEEELALPVLQTFIALMEGAGSYWIRIWFMVPSQTIEHFDKGCLSHLYLAVNEHLMPYTLLPSTPPPGNSLASCQSKIESQNKLHNKVDRLQEKLEATKKEANQEFEKLRAISQQFIEKVKGEHSTDLETVKAENLGLRHYIEELEEKNRRHQDREQKWRKLFEQFLNLAPQVDRESASKNKIRKAFGAFTKLVELAKTSLEEI